MGADGVRGQPASSACDLHPIDFAAVRRGAAALRGFTLDDPAQAEPSCSEAFAQPDGPALVEAVVDPNEPPMPGHVTTEQALHFAKSLVRGEKDRFGHHQDASSRTRSAR